MTRGDLRFAVISGEGLAGSGRRQVREINNVASYLSSNDVRLHVGLGAAKVVLKLSVFWPSGKLQVIENVAVNQILVIDEP